MGNFVCPIGTTAQTDGQGNILYCYDADGNVSYPPSSTPTTGTTPTTGSTPSTQSDPAGLSGFTSIENGLLTAWKTVTAPAAVAPGGLSFAPGGIQISPLLLVGVIALAYILVRK